MVIVGNLETLENFGKPLKEEDVYFESITAIGLI